MLQSNLHRFLLKCKTEVLEEKSSYDLRACDAEALLKSNDGKLWKILADHSEIGLRWTLDTEKNKETVVINDKSVIIYSILADGKSG